MTGMSFRCPGCSRYLITDFVGQQFTRICKCGLTVTIVVPQRMVDKVAAITT